MMIDVCYRTGVDFEGRLTLDIHVSTEFFIMVVLDLPRNADSCVLRTEEIPRSSKWQNYKFKYGIKYKRAGYHITSFH